MVLCLWGSNHKNIRFWLLNSNDLVTQDYSQTSPSAIFSWDDFKKKLTKKTTNRWCFTGGLTVIKKSKYDFVTQDHWQTLLWAAFLLSYFSVITDDALLLGIKTLKTDISNTQQHSHIPEMMILLLKITQRPYREPFYVGAAFFHDLTDGASPVVLNAPIIYSQ